MLLHEDACGACLAAVNEKFICEGIYAFPVGNEVVVCTECMKVDQTKTLTNVFFNLRTQHIYIIK